LNKAFLNGPVDIMWVVHQRDLSRGEGVPSYARLEPKRRSEVKRVFVTSFNEHTGRWISIKNFELPPSSQFPPPVIRLDEVLKWWKKAVGQTKFPNFETRKWKIKKNRWRKENNKEEELGKCYQHATKCVYGCLGEAREREKKKKELQTATASESLHI
jgi:hypothetical protein